MSPEVLTALNDAPMAVLFAWFLFLSFRQRKTTMEVMAAMVSDMMRVISDCCDDEDDA